MTLARSEPSHEQLAERLLLAAQHHLGAARTRLCDASPMPLEDLHSRQFAAIHLGVAVELLAKAVVTELDPVLLSARPEVIQLALVRHLLPIEDHASIGELPSAHQKTIGAHLAITLARRLKPALLPVSAFGELLSLRNAAAHFAEPVDLDRVENALKVAETYEKQVHKVISHEAREALWNFADALGGAAHNQYQEDLLRATRALIGATGERYERLTRGLSPSKLAELEEALVSRFSNSEAPEDARQFAECPACAFGEAVVIGTFEPDEDLLGGGFYVSSSLDCPRCGLTLDSEQLHPAGIDLDLWWPGAVA